MGSTGALRMALRGLGWPLVFGARVVPEGSLGVKLCQSPSWARASIAEELAVFMSDMPTRLAGCNSDGNDLLGCFAAKDGPSQLDRLGNCVGCFF